MNSVVMPKEATDSRGTAFYAIFNFAYVHFLHGS